PREQRPRPKAGLAAGAALKRRRRTPGVRIGHGSGPHVEASPQPRSEAVSDGGSRSVPLPTDPQTSPLGQRFVAGSGDLAASTARASASLVIGRSVRRRPIASAIALAIAAGAATTGGSPT